ncbi:hypothetical protein KKD95_01860, partial [Patescibacteria group bacterium]|nr:hypothetical protein [Patescibacteria group bacterium]
GVSLTNTDTRILDLSEHKLVSKNEEFRIPADTNILPGRTVIFPPEVTGLATSSTRMQLTYPSGELLTEYVVQPEVEEVSTIYMRELNLPVEENTEYEATVVAPVQAVRPAWTGAPLLSLLQGFWPEWTQYRTLSRLYP